MWRQPRPAAPPRKRSSTCSSPSCWSSDSGTPTRSSPTRRQLRLFQPRPRPRPPSYRSTVHVPMLVFSSLFWSEDGLDGVLALFLPNSGHPAPRRQTGEAAGSLQSTCCASPTLFELTVLRNYYGATFVAGTGCRHRLQDSSVSISGCTFGEFRSNRDLVARLTLFVRVAIPTVTNFISPISLIAPNSDPKGAYCTTSPTVRGELCPQARPQHPSQ